MALHTTKTMSPAQAAQVASVSRWTIMRAIKSHNLKASRDNKNQWKIAIDDLSDWMLHTVRKKSELHTVHTIEEGAELRAKLAAETVRADAAERAREQAEADRDLWRAACMEITKMHEAYRSTPQQNTSVLIAIIPVLLTVSIATLIQGVANEDPILGWTLIFLGGVLMVSCVATTSIFWKKGQLQDREQFKSRQDKYQSKSEVESSSVLKGKAQHE